MRNYCDPYNEVRVEWHLRQKLYVYLELAFIAIEYWLLNLIRDRPSQCVWVSCSLKVVQIVGVWLIPSHVDQYIEIGFSMKYIWAILITTGSPRFQNWPCWIKWKVFRYVPCVINSENKKVIWKVVYKKLTYFVKIRALFKHFYGREGNKKTRKKRIAFTGMEQTSLTWYFCSQ